MAKVNTSYNNKSNRYIGKDTMVKFFHKATMTKLV